MVFGLFSKGRFDINTYETELKHLAESISKTNQDITRLNGAKASITRGVVYYVGMVYCVIVGYLVVDLPYNGGKYNWIRFFFMNQLRRRLFLIFGIPLVAHLCMVMVRGVITMIIKRRRSKLELMQKKQKEMIKELKEITNFNATNELLNEYGEEGKREKEKEMEMEKKKKMEVLNKEKELKAKKEATRKESPQNNPMPKQSPPPPPPPTFADKILDLLVGSDSTESIENRYALICSKCYNHCGLAPPGEKEVKFICPYCKFFNGEGIDLGGLQKGEVQEKTSENVQEKVPEKVEKVPEKVEKVPEKVEKVPEKVEKVSDKVEKVSNNTHLD